MIPQHRPKMKPKYTPHLRKSALKRSLERIRKKHYKIDAQKFKKHISKWLSKSTPRRSERGLGIDFGEISEKDTKL